MISVFLILSFLKFLWISVTSDPEAVGIVIELDETAVTLIDSEFELFMLVSKESNTVLFERLYLMYLFIIKLRLKFKWCYRY
jgi:hypothetical protein